MELAGLACAHATVASGLASSKKTFIILAGPGNNGGDGLVMARHLSAWGYKCKVFYPRVGKGELFQGLVSQLKAFETEFMTDLKILQDLLLPNSKTESTNVTNDKEDEEDVVIVVDAIFGFSFQGPPIRSPFNELLRLLALTKCPIISIDVPSGWDVDQGIREMRREGRKSLNSLYRFEKVTFIIPESNLIHSSH